MTTLTLTLSTMLPDGQEVYQQVQLDKQDVDTAISASLTKAYSDLQAAFAAYLAKQTTP